MKLNFVALVFLLTTVAGNFPSPAKGINHGVQRSNVGLSSGRSRVITHLKNLFNSVAKPANPIRDVGKIQQKKHTSTPNLKTSKPSNAKSNKDGRQNMVQPTRSPKLKPSIGKSGNAKSGKDVQTNQRLQKQKDAVQYTTPKSNPSTGKSDNAKSGKTLQQRKTPTSTLKPPKAGRSGNSHNARDEITQYQQDAAEDTPTPTSNPNKAEKSGNSNSGKDGLTKQQQNTATNSITSTFKTPIVEKSGNSSSGIDGQHNVLQNTSTLKPEKSRNSSSDQINETLQQINIFSSRTELDHNYDYRPPQQINYGSVFHPVYQGHPPIYVYKYQDSGSRFDNLLTGLALYNLGRNSQSHLYSANRQYTSTSGEICKLGISKRTGEYEETRIDCNLMSSFIWETTTSAAQNQQYVVKNTTGATVTRTVNGTGNSSVTTMTVTSNTVEDALKVKGPSIAVTPGMTCYMIRTLGGVTVLRTPVACGLLQEYARSSLFRNNAQCLLPFMSTVFNFLIVFIALGKYCE